MNDSCVPKTNRLILQGLLFSHYCSVVISTIMFRKPKRKGPKGGIRKRAQEEDDDDARQEGESTSELILEARKRLKPGTGNSSTTAAADDADQKAMVDVLHTFDAQKEASLSNAELATRGALHLPDKHSDDVPAAGRGADGIYRNQERNKFHAGPIKASGNIRVTARFDYQPDICKDYKDTGFCGFGDTCIYLHDRGDTLSGWQLEQQWEQEQKAKKEAQEKALTAFMDAEGDKSNSKDATKIDLTEDGLPFACHICRQPFTDPVVTSCQHYFCHDCIHKEELCPVCQKETHSVFNEPVKLISKKKKVLGLAKSKQSDSWKLFFEALSGKPKSDANEEDGF